MSDTGYHNCSCRDCFELYVGEPGEMCSDCEEAGCSEDHECCNPDAYSLED